MTVIREHSSVSTSSTPARSMTLTTTTPCALSEIPRPWLSDYQEALVGKTYSDCEKLVTCETSLVIGFTIET